MIRGREIFTNQKLLLFHILVYKYFVIFTKYYFGQSNFIKILSLCVIPCRGRPLKSDSLPPTCLGVWRREKTAKDLRRSKTSLEQVPEKKIQFVTEWQLRHWQSRIAVSATAPRHVTQIFTFSLLWFNLKKFHLFSVTPNSRCHCTFIPPLAARIQLFSLLK